MDTAWEGLNAALRERLRLRLGRHADPSAGVVDSQYAKTTGVGGEQRSYDGGKTDSDSGRAIREPVKGVPAMMHQTVKCTTFCLNCTHEWPTMWNMVEKEPTAVCPKCQWRLGVPIESVS